MREELTGRKAIAAIILAGFLTLMTVVDFQNNQSQTDRIRLPTGESANASVNIVIEEDGFRKESVTLLTSETINLQNNMNQSVNIKIDGETRILPPNKNISASLSELQTVSTNSSLKNSELRIRIEQ